MTIVDILIALILIFAIWRGWSSGILVQLSGIIGVVAGAWVAYNFWTQIAGWLEVDTKYREVLFVVILLGVLLGVILLCHLITKLLRLGGLSAPVRILGVIFSLVKTVILLALLLTAFEYLNMDGRILDPEYLRESTAYIPLKNISEFIFPYLKQLTAAAGSFFMPPAA